MRTTIKRLSVSQIIWTAIIIALLPLDVGAHSAEIENNLTKAAYAGQLSELSRLVKQGANIKDSRALMAAVKGKQMAAVKYLVEQGADLNYSVAWNGPSSWPVYEVAKMGDRELIKYLVDHGADVNAESPTDRSLISTPLITAVYYGDINVARLLIEFGADVNRVSTGGNTALHQAIRYSRGDGPNGNSVEFVKLLLKCGVNPDIKDGSGITARQFAKSSPSGELSALIEQARLAPPNTVQASAAELQQVAFTLLYKEFCDNKLPGFKEKAAPAYEKWQRQNAPLIAQMKDSPQYKDSLARFKEQSKKLPNAANAKQSESEFHELEALCEDGVLEQFNTIGKVETDPQFATPEKTWARYLASLRDGDRQAAIACLTSTARDKFRPLIKQVTKEQLRHMAESIKSFNLTGLKFGEFVEAIATRQDGRGGIIYFQNVGGEWKISEM